MWHLAALVLRQSFEIRPVVINCDICYRRACSFLRRSLVSDFFSNKVPSCLYLSSKTVKSCSPLGRSDINFKQKKGQVCFSAARKGARDIRHPPRYFCYGRTRWFRNFKSTRPPLPPEPLPKVHMQYESYSIRVWNGSMNSMENYCVRKLQYSNVIPLFPINFTPIWTNFSGSSVMGRKKNGSESASGSRWRSEAEPVRTKLETELGERSGA